MTLRVLIVEDQADLADSLSELLSVDGLCKTVGQAHTEADALAWSFHNEAGFDVAVVDLLLKDGSGFTVLAHLVKYQPGTVVVLSDFVNPDIAEKCKQFGAAAAFPKSRIADCIQFIRELSSSGTPSL